MAFSHKIVAILNFIGRFAHKDLIFVQFTHFYKRKKEKMSADQLRNYPHIAVSIEDLGEFTKVNN